MPLTRGIHARGGQASPFAHLVLKKTGWVYDINKKGGRMVIWIIVFVVVSGGILYAIGLYNKLVRNKNMVAEGWSGIEVQLKRRSNLIPNLIETVKGYMAHEAGLLSEIVNLRSESKETRSVSEKSRIESALTRSLGNLLALAEAYPDLKASQNFLDLQDDLSQTENEIQMARRYYNGTVRNLNISIESFPSNLIAERFRFVKADFFDIEDAAEREVPEVKF
ncbi:MAG: LemA family protein [Desulfobacterales bacterium]|jgi:LemA protein